MASPITYNPSLDGYIANEPGTGTWATVRGAATGTAADDTASSATGLYIRQVTPSPNYDIMRWAPFLFDASGNPVPASATITGATFSFYHNSHGNTIGGTPGVVLVSSNPASTSALATGDYDQFGTTAYSDVVLLSDMTNGSRVTLTLNPAGIAAISKNSISKFGLVFDAFRSNTEPTYATGGAEWYVNFNFNESGGSTKPEFVVSYTLPGNDKMFQVF